MAAFSVSDKPEADNQCRKGSKTPALCEAMPFAFEYGEIIAYFRSLLPVPRKMLTFKINEIPQGESTETIQLAAESLEVAPYPLLGGECRVRFRRKGDRLRVAFDVNAQVELLCDRSAEPFSYDVKSSYEVVFDPSVTEDLEDESSAVRGLNISRNEFSIAQDVRDSVLLSIPLKKVHPRFNEEGETSDSGVQQVYSDPDDIDPRWEALKNLKNHQN